MIHSTSWRTSISGFGLGFLISYLLYQLRSIGGGDVKLLAILGLSLGASQILILIWLSFVFGLFFFFIRRTVFSNTSRIIPLGICILMAYLYLRFIH